MKSQDVQSLVRRVQSAISLRSQSSPKNSLRDNKGDTKLDSREYIVGGGREGCGGSKRGGSGSEDGEVEMGKLDGEKGMGR